MIATRMFWELRMVRKLTEPPVVSGTATTKNKHHQGEERPRPDAAEKKSDALSAGAHAGGTGGRAGERRASMRDRSLASSSAF